MVELNASQIDSIFKKFDERGIEPDYIKEIIEDGQYVCIGCGCSDMCACEGGCSWVDVDPTSGFGICSNPECQKLLPQYQDA